MTSEPLPTPADALLVEVFTTATVTAFEELCQTPVFPGEPRVTRTIPFAGRVAEITLRRRLPGRLILAFPQPVLEALAACYLPNEPIASDIADDAAGEFANVIAGQAKTMLKGTPYHFNLSTPKIGQTATTDEADFLILPFGSDAGEFAVCVNLPPCEEDAGIA